MLFIDMIADAVLAAVLAASLSPASAAARSIALTTWGSPTAWADGDETAPLLLIGQRRLGRQLVEVDGDVLGVGRQAFA